MAKARVFFMCSTVVEVDDEVAKAIVKNNEGQFRDSAPVMDDALFGSGIDVLAYPTYEEWKEYNKDIPHRVVGDFNVADKVAARLTHPPVRRDKKWVN